MTYISSQSASTKKRVAAKTPRLVPLLLSASVLLHYEVSPPAVRPEHPDWDSFGFFKTKKGSHRIVRMEAGRCPWNFLALIPGSY